MICGLGKATVCVSGLVYAVLWEFRRNCVHCCESFVFTPSSAGALLTFLALKS